MFVQFCRCCRLLGSFNQNKLTKKQAATRMGFEPTRAEHIGLAVQRLNHSATSSDTSECVYLVLSKILSDNNNNSASFKTTQFSVLH